jgi:glycosyltransferase involved in cell wall biosynthesis
VAAQHQLSASVRKLVAWGGILSPISLVQHPFWSHLASVPAPARLVYDRMDLHEGFHVGMDTYSTGLAQAERALFARADLTILSSAWLDQDTAPHTGRRLLLRNAADFQHFATKPDAPFRDPDGRRVIGYFGAIAEWMDLGLVEATARRFPDCLILLIGHDQCQAGRQLSGLPNVRLTGEMPYARLPHYLHGFDVCILPFLRIPLTLATNPVKVYEYLSAGKPVVSVALPEMEAISDQVTVARDQVEFLRGITTALAGGESPDLCAHRQAFAASQTWSQRADDLRHAVETPSLIGVQVTAPPSAKAAQF